MKKQKGQAIVEFALVLPLFIFLMFGVIYTGMLFADYMTLSNVARASAREAALGTDIDTVKTYYQNHTTLWTSLYTWDSSNSNGFNIEKVTESTTNSKGESTDIESVKVTIQATLNNSTPALSVLNNDNIQVLPSVYNIEYFMTVEK